RNEQMGPEGSAPRVPEAHASSGGIPGWAWIAGASGIVLTGVAVGFLVDERSIQSTIHERCGPDACDRSDGFDPDAANSRLYRDFDLFVVLGATGVVALAVSVIGVATSSRRRMTANVHATASVSKSGGLTRFSASF